MPLPVAHSGLACALNLGFQIDQQGVSWGRLFLFCILANLADIDFLVGFLVDSPNHFHRHYLSHSLGAAAAVGAIVAFFTTRKDRRAFRRNFLIFSTVYFSHVFLDYFGADTSQPYGVPILWPLSTAYYTSPVAVFMHVEKSGVNASFLPSLFVWHNAWALLWEFVVFVPVVTVTLLFKRMKTLMPRVHRFRRQS